MPLFGSKKEQKKVEDAYQFALDSFLAYQMGDLQKAIEIVTSGMRRFPDDIELKVLYGDYMLHSGQNEKIVEEIGPLAKQGARNDFSSVLGRALANLGRFDEAVTSLRDAMRIDPSKSDAHRMFLIDILKKAGRRREAIDEIHEALKRGAEYGKGLLPVLGDLLEEEEDFSGAESAYRKAIQTFPKEPLNRARLGRLLFHTGKVEESISEFKQACAAPVDNPQIGARININFGIALCKIGEYDRADEHLEKAKSLNRNDSAIATLEMCVRDRIHVDRMV